MLRDTGSTDRRESGRCSSSSSLGLYRITEKINYSPPPDWPRPLIPLPTLLLILTFILPLLTAFQLLIYAFLITFATNGRGWSTTILQPPAPIRAYGALVWAANVVLLSLDAATVARAVDLEPTSLGWA